VQIKDHDIDPAIPHPAIDSVIVRHRYGVCVAGDGQPVSRDREALLKELEHGDASGRGQVPVAPEPRIVNRYRIGVALESDRVGQLLDHFGDLAECVEALRQNVVIARGEEGCFPEANHKSPRLQIELEFAFLDFRTQIVSQSVERGK